MDAAGLVDANVVKLGPTGSGTAQTARDVGGNVDVVLSTRATPAQVNTEVVDCLNVDTYAEPRQEAPAARNTLVKKIGYLFKFLRNRISTIATTIKVYADDGTTVDQKSTISDDATTFERGEFGTGP